MMFEGYLAAAKSDHLDDWIRHLWQAAEFPGQRSAVLAAFAGRAALNGRFNASVNLYQAAKKHGGAGASGPGTLVHSDDVIRQAATLARAERPLNTDIVMLTQPLQAALSRAGSGQVAPVVVVAGDNVYLQRFLPSLVASLRRQGADNPLHVHVMGKLTAQTAKMVRTLATSLSQDRRERRFTPTDYICGRFLAAPMIADCWQRDLMIVDIDTLFVGPPGLIVAQMMDGDIGFRPNAHVVPWETIDAATVYVRATAPAHAEMALIARLISEHFAAGNNEYYLDQGVLASVYQARR